jgi:hypothetical protein
MDALLQIQGGFSYEPGRAEVRRRLKAFEVDPEGKW